jgi:prepilin-type N-terminal cleavage/methylation domain-containing protein
VKKNNRGFTLIELMVVLVVFSIVLTLIAQSFAVILKQGAKLFRSEDSNIEGVIGLEMLRHDLSQTGFGLASERSGVPYIGEALAGVSASLNDTPYGDFTGPARPIVALEGVSAGACSTATTGQPDNQGYNLIPCSDYLSIKATTLGSSTAAQRWTYLNYSSNSSPRWFPNSWKASAGNPQTGDSVIALQRDLATSPITTTMITPPGGSFYFQYSATAFNNISSQAQTTVNVFGLNSVAPRMPFNRVDYFVATPPNRAQMSQMCAPNTGVLYKATLNNTNGTSKDGLLTYMPLLDCVAGMQVVLGWDFTGTGLIDTWSNADGTAQIGTGNVAAALLPANNESAATGQSIRNNLKMIKVYILAQDGRLDTNYQSPSPILAGESNETSITLPNGYNIAGNGWTHYRWKLYKIIVTPNNLPANQQ